MGLGFTLGGLELTIGLLGSLPVSLLFTSILPSVWFFFGATIGVSANVSFRNPSSSRDGQCVEMISLHSGPY